MAAITADDSPRRHATRLPLPYLVAAAVLPLVLLALLAWRLVAAAPASPVIGAPAPTFALADLDGRPVRLADLRGRPVIVNFWASWCGPCVEEFPLLQRALDEHASQGLAIIGVVFDDRSEPARAFLQRMGATWPAVMDPNGGVAGAYGVYAPPETFFIDREGRLASRQYGQLSERDLSAQLDAILAAHP